MDWIKIGRCLRSFKHGMLLAISVGLTFRGPEVVYAAGVKTERVVVHISLTSLCTSRAGGVSWGGGWGNNVGVLRSVCYASSTRCSEDAPRGSRGLSVKSASPTWCSLCVRGDSPKNRPRFAHVQSDKMVHFLRACHST